MQQISKSQMYVNTTYTHKNEDFFSTKLCIALVDMLEEGYLLPVKNWLMLRLGCGSVVACVLSGCMPRNSNLSNTPKKIRLCRISACKQELKIKRTVL